MLKLFSVQHYPLNWQCATNMYLHIRRMCNYDYDRFFPAFLSGQQFWLTNVTHEISRRACCNRQKPKHLVPTLSPYRKGISVLKTQQDVNCRRVENWEILTFFVNPCRVPRARAGRQWHRWTVVQTRGHVCGGIGGDSQHAYAPLSSHAALPAVSPAAPAEPGDGTAMTFSSLGPYDSAALPRTSLRLRSYTTVANKVLILDPSSRNFRRYR